MTTLFPTVRSLLIRLLFPLLLLGFNGCQRESSFLSDNTLKVAVAVELSSLDPQITSSIASFKIQSALYETLVKVDPLNGSIIPGGSDRWSVSEDGLSYRFFLREEACWSDGSSVTTEDYYFAFKRLLHPNLGAPFAELYHGIVGAASYHQGVVGDFEHVGVKVISPLELRIDLKERIPYFLSLLARPCTAAIPRDWILEKGSISSRISEWSLRPNFPSCGPYLLEEWVVNKWIKVSKNPNYWNASGVEYEKIVFFPIESAHAQERGFRSGAIDVTSKLPSELVSKYFGSKSFRNQIEMGTFYVIANSESEELQSVDLRRRLSFSIDRELIAENLRQRGEVPAYSFCPPIWGDKYQVQKSVVAAADERVTETRPLKFLIPSSENNNIVAEALQDMWERKLGVKIEIYRQEWKSYLDSRNRGEFDLCLATWIGDYFDPLTFLEMWKSDGANNFCNWRDSSFDELLDESTRLLSEEERFIVMKTAEDRLMEAAVVFPLFYLGRVFLVSEELKEWPQSILNTIDYSRIEKKTKI